MLKIDILGSCVTRDALEFAAGAEAGRYVARQSIASIFAAPPSATTLAALEIDTSAREMAQRATLQDFHKTAIAFLDDGLKSPIVIDLIDERTGLAITECGALVTDSQANHHASNARALYARRIPGFCEEHLRLFCGALPLLAKLLAGRVVVIHHAYYAPGPWGSARFNTALQHMYKALADALPRATSIEVDGELRCSSASHKWGDAPYHYIDAYYQRFVEKLGGTILGIEVRAGVTMQINHNSNS